MKIDQFNRIQHAMRIQEAINGSRFASTSCPESNDSLYLDAMDTENTVYFDDVCGLLQKGIIGQNLREVTYDMFCTITELSPELPGIKPISTAVHRQLNELQISPSHSQRMIQAFRLGVSLEEVKGMDENALKAAIAIRLGQWQVQSLAYQLGVPSAQIASEYSQDYRARKALIKTIKSDFQTQSNKNNAEIFPVGARVLFRRGTHILEGNIVKHNKDGAAVRCDKPIPGVTRNQITVKYPSILQILNTSNPAE